MKNRTARNGATAKLLGLAAALLALGLLALMIIDFPAPTRHVEQTLPNEKFQN